MFDFDIQLILLVYTLIYIAQEVGGGLPIFLEQLKSNLSLGEIFYFN